MSEQPDISIIMAIRNSEHYLAEALASIAAQNYPAIELIAVDGGSRDGGPSMVQNFPNARCIPQRGTGFTGAWNTGVQATRAPFIAFLDSDDIWAPEKLAGQMAVLRANPFADAVYGRVAFFLERGHALPSGFRPAVLEGTHLVPMPGVTLLRRGIVERLGSFDEKLSIASDIAWFAKLRDRATLAVFDQLVLRKRLHNSNLGHITPWPIFRGELLTLLKARVDGHRRAAAGANDA